MNDDSSITDSSKEKPANEAVDKAKTAKPRRSKVHQLQEEIAALKQELADAKEQMLRRMAEFDNFRKRKNKESVEWSQAARENVLKDLLPVVDDFDRLFRNHAGDDDVQWQGVRLIYDKFLAILRNQGLTPMEPEGKPFDPEYHDALITVPRDDVPPGTVVEVHENGYLMNNHVLRHAKVMVSKAAEPDIDIDKTAADAAQEQ